MTLEEIIKLAYWWCQKLDHELGLAESTGVDWDSFCREVCEITLLESSERLGGEGKFCRLMKASLRKGSIIEDIMWKDNGYLAV